MLKKLVLYSIAAIALGVITMMMPIGLILLLPKALETAVTQESRKPLTGGYSLTIDSLREAAQFYGKSDIVEGVKAANEKASFVHPPLTTHNILALLMIVVSAGLLAALITKLAMWAIKGR
ncbi:MAG: hypothetical protein QXH97_04695 [Candidatus Bathyarchaeia archaeon]